MFHFYLPVFLFFYYFYHFQVSVILDLLACYNGNIYNLIIHSKYLILQYNSCNIFYNKSFRLKILREFHQLLHSVIFDGASQTQQSKSCEEVIPVVLILMTYDRSNNPPVIFMFGGATRKYFMWNLYV